MTSTDISYQDRGTYCVPIYTSTSNQVSNLLNQLPLTSNRKDYNHSRHNALSSILRSIQLDVDNIIYCPLNKSAYTVWGWPISYKPMVDILDMLCHAEWLIRKKPSGLVGSEESDLGFPLHPECAIQTDANWYFLHGIFG